MLIIRLNLGIIFTICMVTKLFFDKNEDDEWLKPQDTEIFGKREWGSLSPVDHRHFQFTMAPEQILSAGDSSRWRETRSSPPNAWTLLSLS